MTYLFVELDEGGLELLLDISTLQVVGELVVGQGHGGSVLSGSIVALSGVGHHVKWDGLVLGVSDLVKVHVRNLLVLDLEWQVRGSIARELWEVL